MHGASLSAHWYPARRASATADHDDSPRSCCSTNICSADSFAETQRVAGRDICNAGLRYLNCGVTFSTGERGMLSETSLNLRLSSYPSMPLPQPPFHRQQRGEDEQEGPVVPDLVLGGTEIFGVA